MAYLPFTLFSAAVPLASAGSQTYNFQRPSSSVSSVSGYDVDFSATDGVFSVSVLVGGVEVSAVQVSATSDNIHLVSTESGAASAVSAFDVAAGDTLQVVVTHLSGGVADDFLLTVNAYAAAATGELVFTTAVLEYGVNMAGSLPAISAEIVDPAAGLFLVGTSKAYDSNVTTTLSSDSVINSLVGPHAYLVQGDTFAYISAVSAVSALNGVTDTVSLAFVDSHYSGSRALDAHLLGRRQGQF